MSTVLSNQILFPFITIPPPPLESSLFSDSVAVHHSSWKLEKRLFHDFTVNYNVLCEYFFPLLDAYVLVYLYLQVFYVGLKCSCLWIRWHYLLVLCSYLCRQQNADSVSWEITLTYVSVLHRLTLYRQWLLQILNVMFTKIYTFSHRIWIKDKLHGTWWEIKDLQVQSYLSCNSKSLNPIVVLIRCVTWFLA